MKLYTGMDLHSNNTYIGISDEDDKRVFKGRFPNQLPVILKVLEPYKEKIVGIVVEFYVHFQLVLAGGWDDGERI